MATLPTGYSAPTNKFTLHQFKAADTTAGTLAGIKDEHSFEIKGLDQLAKDITDLKTSGGTAAGMDAKKWFTHASTAVPAALIPTAPAVIAAIKSWSADNKLNKVDAGIRQGLSAAMKDVKIPGWLKASAIATLLVSAAGFVSGMGQKAAHKAAQRI